MLNIYAFFQNRDLKTQRHLKICKKSRHLGVNDLFLR